MLVTGLDFSTLEDQIDIAATFCIQMFFGKKIHKSDINGYLNYWTRKSLQTKKVVLKSAGH